MQISTIHGKPTSRLGLAAYPDQDADCVGRAFESGINFFFLYSPGSKRFVQALNALARNQRDNVILASGCGSRSRNGMQTARRKIFSAVGIEMIDIFFAEYIHPGDHASTVFGRDGVLDELQRWKADGKIRVVGATTHDRSLARRLAEDPRVDVLMHRFNMAHRKAADEVFPIAIKSKTPVIAFTATRWGTLLKPQPEWADDLPTAADCYRYCLAEPAVHVVLTAPKSIKELHENLAAAKSPPMNDEMRRRWDRFGNIVYKLSGGPKNDYESRWP